MSFSNVPFSEKAFSLPGSREDSTFAWLKEFGFRFNPFAYTESEKDQYLDHYYIEPESFPDIVKAEHTLVYADYGAGKTATRRKAESHFHYSFLSRRIFAFAYPISDKTADFPPVSLEGHLPEIITAAVNALFICIAQYGAFMPGLHENELAATTLARFFDACYPIGGDWRDDLKTAIQERSLKVCLRAIGRTLPGEDDGFPGGLNWVKQWHAMLISVPIDTSELVMDMAAWETLQEIMTHEGGIRHIVALVDGVDTRRMNKTAERMYELVKPLVEEGMKGGKLGKNVLFKLFIPLEIRPLLYRSTRKIKTCVLEWTSEQLNKLIESRFIAATYGRVVSLEQLCEIDFYFDVEKFQARLVRLAKHQPRILVHELMQLFSFAAMECIPNQRKGNKRNLISHTCAKGFWKRYKISRQDNSRRSNLRALTI